MKVALVHDDFTQAGGAENLFAEIASIYPQAPIYTSVVNWHKLPSSISRQRIKTSFIQKIPLAAKFYKLLLPLYPLAFESLDLSGFDIVISSTTRFSKGIITQPKTIHVCYVNSVPRFLWNQSKQQNYLPKLPRLAAKPIFNWLKRWDKVAASRVDFYIANSANVAKKVKEAYGRDANVIYPCIDLNLFTPLKIHKWKLKSQDYYLIVSRLVKWKNIDIAIEAAKDLGFNLKIAGEGPDDKRLKKLAKGSKNIEFLGRVDEKVLLDLYRNAKFLIITQEEDFGLSVLEAQACGLGAIAYEKGGAPEIIAGYGILFKRQSKESLKDAIEKSKSVKWNLSEIRKNSLKFSKKEFEKNLTAKIKQYAPPKS
ncbi:glycosyltransferase [Candidatus Curtissbacteria bacterium]|nr:glycosyltransferase [Candidatus Curtissbacteria bacterium]